MEEERNSVLLYTKGIDSKKAGSGERGSITLEAAVFLPFFICVIVSIVFLVKIVYIQEFVRRAAAETAEDMASHSYLIYRSGINNTLEEWVAQGFDKGLTGSVSNEGGMPAALLEWLSGIAKEELTDGIRTQMMMPVVRPLLKKHLSGPRGQGAHEYLLSLGIEGGYRGLDLSGSEFLCNGTDDVLICIGYDIRIPVPFRIAGKLHFRQQACSRAWMGGDMPSDEDIWALDNLSRGKRIREIFGANLPWGFPGISSFKNGTAVLIRSMDITAVSYSSPKQVEETVNGYTDKLADYRGQAVPWGREKIVIKPGDISSRKLLLVIPSNELSGDVEQAIQRSRRYAVSKGIILEIRRYGRKKTIETENE